MTGFKTASFLFFFFPRSKQKERGNGGGKRCVGQDVTYVTIPMVALHGGGPLVLGAFAGGVVVDWGGAGEGGGGEEGHCGYVGD